MRLLCADDSATIRKLAEISFRNTGFSLDFAATGAEAVAKALSAPDVMLLDYALPDMKAADVCRSLAADPRSAQVRVILVSSKTSIIREELRRFAQVVGYLAKPFSSEELVAQVTAAGQGVEATFIHCEPPVPDPAFRQKEAAAQIIYARLRRQLERLPAWAAERGAEPAGPFFARKLITPEVVEGLLADLAPLLREQPPGAPPSAAGDESALQRELESLRRPSDWAGAESLPLDLDLVYERAPGFSGQLRGLQLSASEQRVLAMVDGSTPLSLLSERTALPGREVGRILSRLGTVRLVQLGPPARSPLRPDRPDGRLVAVLDHDRQGVPQALQSLLHRRPNPIQVRDLLAEPDPLAAIERDRPFLVLLNGEGTPVDIAELAQQIRRHEFLARTALAAVLERHAAGRIDRLAAAGFDAVWVKPLHFSDVTQLMASAFRAANSAGSTRDLAVKQ